MLYLFIIVCIWLLISFSVHALSFWIIWDELKYTYQPKTKIIITPRRLMIDIISFGYFIYYFVK